METDVGHPLRTRLSLGDQLAICQPSLSKQTHLRDSLAETLVASYHSDSDQLVKGQSSDIWDWVPRRDLTLVIASELPECTQEIIFVWADTNELRRRCLARPNPETYDWNNHDFDRELQLLMQWVVNLDLPIHCVKNPDGGPLAIAERPSTWPA
jgi:hypothetical protein